MSLSSDFICDFCSEFYMTSDVDVISSEFDFERGSKAVRYYPDGTGYPGDDFYYYTNIDLEFKLGGDSLKRLLGKGIRCIDDLIIELNDMFKRCNFDMFEEFFGEDLLDVIKDFERIPNYIFEKDIYKCEFYSKGDTLCLHLGVSLRGE